MQDLQLEVNVSSALEQPLSLFEGTLGYEIEVKAD